MAVTLRLVRLGRRNRAFFRLRASDDRNPSTGRFLEELGSVDPIQKDETKQVILKKDRIEHWLGLGATTSDTVETLLRKNGIVRKEKVKKPKKPRKAKAAAPAAKAGPKVVKK